jgi:hypothetical protein
VGATAAALLRLPDADVAGAAAPSDSTVLARTLRIEQLVVIAYERVLASGLVAPAVSAQLHTVLGQEHRHVAVLERALRELSAMPPQTSNAAAQRELAAHHVQVGLNSLGDQHDCLKLLIDVESLAEGAYFAAISKLTDPRLLRTSIAAMGCEAQHWTLLSAIQHPGKLYRSVPYPFVQGSP